MKTINELHELEMSALRNRLKMEATKEAHIAILVAILTCLPLLSLLFTL